MWLFITIFFSTDGLTSESQHLALINGHWHCVQNIKESEISIKITSKYSYNASEYTYIYDAVSKYKYLDKLDIGSINVRIKGSFTYKESKMKYTTAQIQTNIISNPLGGISTDMIKDLEQAFREDTTEYHTTLITDTEWETVDPTNNEKTRCFRQPSKLEV
ncbi:hypothetical protein A7985_08810 [Pseudoalteromonas luteoviolacea]|uniref:Uncharacterized protein n=1 Tax=Pseudoalteromonas luteoviolacea TaxID=43657 RepID=A0A1C0TRL1_9GAMM|nr:hypothetical protein [Pseudoalteromonas luteoviolacea]OCQ21899.1 hypothetical protein A7985_08810 [Pseudoalteromonas luteoviolacea]